MNVTKESIIRLRTVTLPAKLGLDSLSQPRFGAIVAKIAKKVTGIDTQCAGKTVQDWELGKTNPGQVNKKAIEYLMKITGEMEDEKIKMKTYYDKEFYGEFDSILSKFSDSGVKL